MANELKKVGLVFTQEGAVDFKKTLQDINLEMNKNYNQFRLTQSQWDSSTASTEKLRAQQEYLTNAYQIQQDKISTLKMQLEELESAENKNTTAIKKKRNELTNAEIKLKDYESKIKDVESALNNTGKKIENYGKKINDVSEKINDVGNKVSVVSAGVAAGGIALANNAMNLENAVAKYVSTTNTAEKETEKYRKVLENINNNNYGEGYEDIADSMAQVTMQLKDLNEQDLQNITEKAIALRDLFGYDVSESIRAVKAMMDNLSVSADEAFNLIAEGKKQGLDFSNELLDNINEYSVQFGKLGLSAEDMFNIFKVGADNGAFNLDKIGDAVKEFSIRVIDGSNTTVDGFKRIGLNADDMAKKFANGGEEAKQAFIEVVNRLGRMDDKVSQSIAGVDLFGTMWEDLGPTVITSFTKMDNGISKSSDSMQESIDKLYNTTKKKAETQLKRLQSLGADFGEEMLPVLEDLIDMAEDFIEKLESMSDEEKKNIVNIGLFVAGLGPLIKTVGTAGQVIGGVTKGIGTFTQAIGVAKGNVESTSGVVNGLTKVFSGITSPIGLAITGISSLAGAYMYVKTEASKLPEVLQEIVDETSKAKQAHEEYRNELDKTASSNLTEIENSEKLRDELYKLVDVNGKVKDGYEDRVNFILNELNAVLGTEYSLTGNIINQYKKLQEEIDLLILKKKAQIVLENEEGKYSYALKNINDAYKKMIDSQNEYNNVLSQYGAQTYEDLFEKLKQNYIDAGYTIEKATEHATSWMSKWVDGYRESYEVNKTVYNDYLSDIAKYENDYTILQSNNTEKIKQMTDERINSYARENLSRQEQLNIGIQQEIYNIQELKKLREEDLKNQNYISAEANASAIKSREERLNSLIDDLIAQTSIINENSPEIIEAWKQLATESYSVYYDRISEMPPELSKKIQEMTGVTAERTPELVEETKKMAQSVLDEIKVNKEFKKEAIKNLQGFLSGLSDVELRELLKEAGVENVEKVMEGIKKRKFSRR